MTLSSGAYGVIIFYASLVVWTLSLVMGLRKGRGGFGPFILIGIGILLSLNVRYFLDGAPAGIAFFVGIYDVVMNFAASKEGKLPSSMGSCEGNGCSVWGDTYDSHPNWGVAFHERFVKAPEITTKLFYGHLTFQTLASS